MKHNKICINFPPVSHVSSNAYVALTWKYTPPRMKALLLDYAVCLDKAQTESRSATTLKPLVTDGNNDDHLIVKESVPSNLCYFDTPVHHCRPGTPSDDWTPHCRTTWNRIMHSVRFIEPPDWLDEPNREAETTDPNPKIIHGSWWTYEHPEDPLVMFSHWVTWADRSELLEKREVSFIGATAPKDINNFFIYRQRHCLIAEFAVTVQCLRRA